MNARPSTIEIVGPAGTGKTTLALALGRGSRHVHPVFSFRKASYVAPFATCMLRMLPTFCLQPLYGRWFSWRDMRMMIHLQALCHFVERRGLLDDTITVFDQGPVYMLIRLHESFFQNVKDQRLQRWWSSTLDTWTAALNAIVILDAPDVTLVERIRSRTKWHSVKQKPDQEARMFLYNFRSSCEQVISGLTARGGPVVFSFNTGQASLDCIAHTILTSLDARPCDREAVARVTGVFGLKERAPEVTDSRILSH